MSPIGFEYFVTFVNDFSWVTWLYLMKSLSEIFFFPHISVFCEEIQTQFHVSVQTLRSDNYWVSRAIEHTIRSRKIKTFIS